MAKDSRSTFKPTVSYTDLLSILDDFENHDEIDIKDDQTIVKHKGQYADLLSMMDDFENHDEGGITEM